MFLEIGDNGKVLFRIKAASLRWLESQVYAGIKAIPGKGLEIGGLTVGAISHEEDLAGSTIEHFAGVDIKYLLGPSFRPGEEDRPALTEALSNYPAGGLHVIGYYRSHLGGEPEIREDDRWFLRELFGDRTGLLILLQAALFQTSIVHIYARISREDIRLVHRFPLANIPADEVTKVEEVEKPADVPVAPPPPEPQHAVEAAPVPQFAATVPANVWWQRPALLLIPLALLLLLGVFELTRRPASVENASGGLVGLSMQTRADKVEFLWNVGSAAVENAVRGTLVIVRQANVTRVDLDSAQVRTGRYEYKGPDGALTCEIMLFQGDNAFAGQTRDFDVKTGGSAVTPIPEPPIVETVASAGRGAEGGATPAVIPAPKIRTPGIPAPSKQPQAFVPPPPALTSRTVLPAEAPPVLNAAPPVLTTAPPAALLDGSTSPLITPPQRSQPVVFSAPVPVLRVTPSISPGVRALLHDDTVIKVVIEVDRLGKVTEATSAAENTGIEKLLVPQAVQAAKLWKFEPARRNGVAVAGETVVMFKFEK